MITPGVEERAVEVKELGIMKGKLWGGGDHR